MTITSVSQWSTTPADNTDLDGVSIAEGVAVISGMNNAIRNLMAQVAAALNDGTFATTIPWTVATASNASYLDFAEDTDNGLHYVRLIGPAALSANVTVTLPSGTGTLPLLESANAWTGEQTFTNTGLHILDTNATHDLIVKPGSNITADRTLTIATGDADRTIDLGSSLTIPADPNADRLWFWDDSEGKHAYLTLGPGLAVTDTTIDVTSTGGQPVPSSSTFAVGTLVFARTTAGSTANGGTITGSSILLATAAGGALGTGGTQTGTWTNRSGTTLDTSGTNYGYVARTA